MPVETLLHSEIDDRILCHLVETTENVISVQSTAEGRDLCDLPPLRLFVSQLIEYTNVYTATLLMTLVYLRRLEGILPSNAQGLPSTRHRIFLSCLILSAKNHNDSSPLNRHWAKYTNGLFSLKDINLMERQLLSLLNWDVLICEQEMVRALEPLLVLERPAPTKLYKVARNESFMSTSSSATTLVSGSQQDLAKSLRDYKIVAHASESLETKKGNKSWSLGNIMRQCGLK